MKWSDELTIKTYFVLMALASLVIAALASGKWE
jgi:hypothetical protein